MRGTVDDPGTPGRPGPPSASSAPPTEGTASTRAARPDFHIGDRLVQPDLCRVLTPETVFQVEPKIMAVLLYLVDSGGRVVSRADLLDDVWGRAHVTEDVLTRAVVHIRKIFDDDPSAPRVIETIRTRGYRFLATPRADHDANASPRQVWPAYLLGLLALVVLITLTVSGHQRTGERPASTGDAQLRLRPLTSYSGSEFDAAISPDGSKVAFAWDSGEPGSSGLFVSSADSTSLLRLTEGDASDQVPTWSPTADRIAFARGHAGECWISVVPASGGAVAPLARCANVDEVQIDWSPDGRSLVVAGLAEGTPAAIELLDIQTLARGVLTHPDDGLRDHSPSFSSDGDRVAFVRSHNQTAEDLHVVSTEGGRAQRLTFDLHRISGVDWAPDDASLVFSSDRGGTSSLWRIYLEDGRLESIAGGGSKLKRPSIARSEELLAFESWAYEINVWRQALGPDDGGEPKVEPFIVSTQLDFDPAASPSGEAVAFISTRSGSHEMWLADSRGHNAVRLTDLEASWAGMPSWSPDGKDLVFVVRHGPRSDIYRVALADRVPVRLTDDPGTEIAPSWSRDRQWIYYGSHRSGKWEIWKTPAAGGRGIQVTLAGGLVANESLDGRFLYYSKADEPGLWRQAIDGEVKLVLSDLLPGRRSWILHKHGLFALTLDSTGALTLESKSLENLASVRVASLKPFARQGFSVSPDGSWILFARIDRRESDIHVAQRLD